MLLYHQVRVGGELLANKGSVPSHIKLKEDNSEVEQREDHLRI